MNAVAKTLDVESVNDDPALDCQALAADELAMIGGGVAVINSI
jgi:hypothetical protein